MDKQTATQLIGNTFNYPFDEGRFRNFAINLLNNVDEAKRFDYISGTYIRHSFKNHISKYKRLGTYTDPNGDKIDVLVVQLKNEWALERSRTMLRNFTSDYLKNRDEKDAALVAYYTTNPDDWRFSYIRMEYKREKTESGKFRITQDITPAKRYSFLVGKNEPNHTAQSQLISILEDDRKNPTLDALETAFSVDAVTKQFYKDYRAQFEKLWHELNDIVAKDPKIAAEFETKTIDTANFAKKLMGQIVFLYFLQKKGWLGVGKDDKSNFKDWGTGPKNFLRRLFNKEFTDYGNFFNDVLEPLFYEALATERTNDVFTRFNCKIPFLNGGLFEPINDYNWEETDIRIDNDLIGDVLKTFDRYNFTVREDEPLEKEVAVDPEMLGKVFENLLPENLRKGKGAYYTPRTIVHYMCQESLINYLDTTINSPLERGETSEEVSGCVVPKADIETLVREGDIILELETAIVEQGKKYDSVLMDSIKENAKELDYALANIKVCDPAIGSGAFPVGMLTEIVKARKVLELYLDKKLGVYELKRHCIQNSLYGVDIDPGAIEIAKLRLWLSLVVDEDDYTTIQPLPNLDYKIMQGNSLIEEFYGISLDIEKKPDEQIDVFTGGSSLDVLIEDLHQKQADFFNAEHPREKKKKREAVETAIYNVFHNEFEKKKSISSVETKVIETDLKEMTHGNKLRNFFPWKLYFADVFRNKGGFDLIIGNPPYGLVKDKSLKTIYRKLYPETEFKIDLYSLFLLRAIQLYKSNSNGISNFIITNTLLDNYYESKVREKLLNETKILEINDLSDKIFEEAVVHSMIISFKNSKIEEYNIKTDISEEIVGDIFFIPSNFFRQ
ncbi:MAG: N-6 DNA methylase, partial [Candidatus Marinimicrobia bacterium]|nr:N-6 DNA methylase [Candidatus Neomarinimicrobiota bacterium]